MTFRRLVLLAPAAYLLHIREEGPRFVAWTRLYPNLFVNGLSTRVFIVTNLVYMAGVVGAVALCVRRSNVVAGLSVAAWELSNAAFHIVLTLASGIYSPGVVTAGMLYVPLSVATFYRAHAESHLTLKRATGALFLGMVVANIPLRIVQYALRYA